MAARCRAAPWSGRAVGSPWDRGALLCELDEVSAVTLTGRRRLRGSEVPPVPGVRSGRATASFAFGAKATASLRASAMDPCGVEQDGAWASQEVRINLCEAGEAIVMRAPTRRHFAASPAVIVVERPAVRSAVPERPLVGLA